MCAEHKKLRKLLKHLETVREAGRGARNPPRVLVFANHVKAVRFLATTLAGAGFKTAMLHGERSQPEREVGDGRCAGKHGSPWHVEEESRNFVPRADSCLTPHL